MNRPVAPPVGEGEVVAGKYRVERVIGAGGMGVVVAAQHLQLKQRVAIKFLLSGADPGSDSAARFLREAQAAARIQSEHVTRVLDVAALDDGTPYMVMEFLEGRDLGALLAEKGPLPLEDAVGYVLQACEGIAEAHAAGIVHRDIKPSNFFLAERARGRPVVKVLDFGISKVASSGASGGEASLTQSTALMGSPLYMSPEQMTSSKHVDERADIWSLGASLFELTCGSPPFTGESITEVIAKVLQSDAPSVRQLRVDLPPAFAEVLARTLQKDRDRRYASVAELAVALAPFGPRYAELAVERISEILGTASRVRLELQETQRAAEAPAMIGAAARAVSAGGGTTSKPVWGGDGPAVAERAKSRTPVLAGALVGAALLGAAGTAWVRSGARSIVSATGGSATGATAADGAGAVSALPDAAPATPPAQTSLGLGARLDAGPQNTPPTASTVHPFHPHPVDPWERRN